MYSSTGAALYLGVASALINPALSFAPLIVGGLVLGFEVSTVTAVTIVSAELFASAIAALPAVWWAHRLRWRKVAMFSLCGIGLGNLLSAYCGDIQLLLVIRVLTGFLEGSVLVLCLLVIAGSAQPEKLFSAKLALQMASVALGLALTPLLIAAWGLSSLFLLLAIAALCLLPGVAIFDNQQASSATGIASVNDNKLQGWGYLSLALLVLFGASINLVWTYQERIAAVNNITIEQVGFVLSGATLCGIATGLIASKIGLRYGRLMPISVGIAFGIFGSLLLITLKGQFLVYTVGVILLALARVLPIPYMFGFTAVFDKRKSLIVMSHVALAIGMAIGPGFAAVLEADTQYELILSAAIVLMAVSWLLSIKLNKLTSGT